MQKQVGPIIIAFVVIVLLAAGWFYWRHLTNETPAGMTQPTTTSPGFGPAPTPVPLNPAGRLQTGTGQTPGPVPVGPAAKPQGGAPALPD